MKRFGPFSKRDTGDAAFPPVRFEMRGQNARATRLMEISFAEEPQFDVPIAVAPVQAPKGGRNRLHHFLGLAILGVIFLTGCNFAPKYQKPAAPAPAAYKELTPDSAKEVDGWKTATPNDAALRGKWWEVFNDPQLNTLEDQVNISNQTVAVALANFLSARAVVKQNVSQFFPTVTANPSVTRSRQSAARAGSGISSNSVTLTEYSLPLDASWEPDFWGRVRNTVKASRFEAQASLADLENTRLTVQSEVAADYFQIRSLDAQEKLLNDAVNAYRESLRLTQVRHDTGIASDQDVAQAEIQLNSTAAQATDIGIQRAQVEHALAVLVGKAPADFSLSPEPLESKPVAVPFGVPSGLLERRPDIAAAERRVAAANAQIGVARSAYFPNVTLSASGGYESSSTVNLFSGPALVWSLGAAAAQTIFDAGNKFAVTAQAKAQYQGQAATYRQTVLGAFQDVEDNLAALRLLSREIQQEDAAVASSQRYLNLANDRYRLGIDSYLNVITAQTTLLGNQRTAVGLRLNQMTATVQLIKALGGGWSGDLTKPPGKQAAGK
ncbi:MAG TPA: efflux transporter outer membrane subunit [Verrucomicrobiae bacterium]|jgi:NodT family efflux transporter outer membrane factor (OMF) lipoprotein|nr:efflux transporter outer membrane subunit [Verrucomicrobiae bacterium]